MAAGAAGAASAGNRAFSRALEQPTKPRNVTFGILGLVPRICKELI
jgi:hypothetical protein